MEGHSYSYIYSSVHVMYPISHKIHTPLSATNFSFVAVILLYSLKKFENPQYGLHSPPVRLIIALKIPLDKLPRLRLPDQ